MITLSRKREKILLHLANTEFVAKNSRRLRLLRDTRSQQDVADSADVVQSYISRVESGTANGIGFEALCRILKTYEEFEDASGYL